MDTFTGHYTPHNNMSSCVKCNAGQYAAARAYECVDCREGYMAPNTATVSCAACPPGKIAPRLGTVNCSDCRPGFEIIYIICLFPLSISHLQFYIMHFYNFLSKRYDVYHNSRKVVYKSLLTANIHSRLVCWK